MKWEHAANAQRVRESNEFSPNASICLLLHFFLPPATILRSYSLPLGMFGINEKMNNAQKPTVLVDVKLSCINRCDRRPTTGLEENNFSVECSGDNRSTFIRQL